MKSMTAMGVKPEMFTSYGAVLDAICSLISNPFQIGCVVLAVLGVFIDTTTAGVSDSTRALTYTTHNKE